MSETSPGRRHRTGIQVRFGDTDALGHVNNASYAAYAELGRLDFLGRFEGVVGSIILASLHIDFRRQVTFGENVHVETWVERLGRSSITLAQAIHAGDRLAADVRSTVVYYDYEAGASRPLTDEMRNRLEPFHERHPGASG